MVARAVENGMALFGANPTGEHPFPLAGTSMAVSATGSVEALESDPAMLLTQVGIPDIPQGLDPFPLRRQDIYRLHAQPPHCIVL